MPDLKTTLTDLKAALEATIGKIDALSQSEIDSAVRTAIESDVAFFTCVQARNTALQGAISEKVRRNRAGWLCQGTAPLLQHVADEFVDPAARLLMDDDQRRTGVDLAKRALKLAVDAKALAGDLNQPQS